MRLLVDIGNTFIHFAICNKDSLKTTFQVDNKLTSSLIIENIEKHLNSWNKFIKYCVISSVNPKINSILKVLIEKYKWKTLIINSNLKSNIIYNLEDNINLGADLIAAAVGAKTKYLKQDIIIVMLGTATTITCVKNNEFIGGAILAGLHISQEVLMKRTALLKNILLKPLPKNLLGRNTNDAVSVGLIYGHILAIEGIVNKYKKILKKPVVLLSGGNYKFLQKFLNDYIVEEHLIFYGLNTLWSLNKE